MLLIKQLSLSSHKSMPVLDSLLSSFLHEAARIGHSMLIALRREPQFLFSLGQLGGIPVVIPLSSSSWFIQIDLSIFSHGSKVETWVISWRFQYRYWLSWDWPRFRWPRGSRTGSCWTSVVICRRSCSLLRGIVREWSLALGVQLLATSAAKVSTVALLMWKSLFRLHIITKNTMKK